MVQKSCTRWVVYKVLYIRFIPLFEGFSSSGGCLGFLNHQKALFFQTLPPDVLPPGASASGHVLQPDLWSRQDTPGKAAHIHPNKFVPQERSQQQKSGLKACYLENIIESTNCFLEATGWHFLFCAVSSWWLNEHRKHVVFAGVGNPWAYNLPTARQVVWH